VDELAPAEFFHVSLVRGAKGKYKVFVAYDFEGETFECWTDNSYDDIELAKAERAMILRESISDPEHGDIELDDLVWVEIRQRIDISEENDNNE